MFEANLQGMIEALNEAEANDFGHEGPINGYLFEHIIRPIFRGEMPDPDAICYDAFDIPDIYEAYEYLEEEESMWNRSLSLAEGLRKLPSKVFGGFC